VAGFEHENDARRFLDAMRDRWGALPFAGPMRSTAEEPMVRRLSAGGKWIRTLRPAKVTCLKRGLYITGSSSTSTRALPPAERGAARFGGGDGSEHLLWRRIRDAAACVAG